LSAEQSTMVRAVQVERFGDSRELGIVQLALRPPGAGEIVVRHAWSGLNFTDVYQRSGLHPVSFQLPLSLGMEASGVVEAVGEGVVHLAVGERVAYACHPPGSYAEARTMPAQNVCRLPDAIGLDTAAAMMLKGMTAHYLLKRCHPPDGLRAGDPILFHAAAGGVGLLVCQWARHLGLKLIATAGSDEKCALALENGAAHVINYRREDFTERVKDITGGEGVAVAYDAVGKDTWAGSIACLRPFGLAVSFGMASGPLPGIDMKTLGKKASYVTSQSLFNFMTGRAATQAMAEDLFDVVTSGAVKVLISRRFLLDDIRLAHDALQSRATVGSMIVGMQ
jgi:NADPH2:quinone reductase